MLRVFCFVVVYIFMCCIVFRLSCVSCVGFVYLFFMAIVVVVFFASLMRVLYCSVHVLLCGCFLLRGVTVVLMCVVSLCVVVCRCACFFLSNRLMSDYMMCLCWCVCFWVCVFLLRCLIAVACLCRCCCCVVVYMCMRCIVFSVSCVWFAWFFYLCYGDMFLCLWCVCVFVLPRVCVLFCVVSLLC